MSLLHIYSKIGTAREKNRSNAELLSFCECKNRNLRQILALETMSATFFHNFFFAEYLACQAPANPGRPKNRPTKSCGKKLRTLFLEPGFDGDYDFCIHRSSKARHYFDFCCASSDIPMYYYVNANFSVSRIQIIFTAQGVGSRCSQRVYLGWCDFGADLWTKYFYIGLST